MARRSRRKQDRLDQVLTSVQRRFSDTPLRCIGGRLEETISALQKGLNSDGTSHDDAERLAVYIESLMGHLPQSFGPRFHFDAGMISALSDEWSTGNCQLSRMIIPQLSSDWGHQSIPLPAFANDSIDVIDMILFPGRASLQDVDLLNYPFLCHELGHNVLFKFDEVFGPKFASELDQFSHMLQRRSLADKGAAKQKAQRSVDEIRQLWGPSPTHKNWAHEIAADIIALWTCGPAYVAALLDVLEDSTPNPYHVDQAHPPYELRAKSLLHAGELLGWAAHLNNLHDVIETWNARPCNANVTTATSPTPTPN